MEGICVCPVLSHPAWDDDRYSPTGLFELESRHGRRLVHAPLAKELRRQQAVFGALFAKQVVGITAGRDASAASA